MIRISLGSNLKQIRLFRGKALKQLGQEVGFSLTTAHTRIIQYEKDQKIPKKIRLMNSQNIWMFLQM